MRRPLILGLSLLLVAGCTTTLERRLQTLQNPQIAGDANRDLVPYQARQRAFADCVWPLMAPEKMDAFIKAADADTAMEQAIRACMAGKGWL
jgi:hypothetical protein